MTEEQMLQEIRSLRSEMDMLGDQMLSIRYEDIRCVFIEQMRLAMGEEGRRSFRSEATHLRSSSVCQNKDRCLSLLSDGMESAADRFIAGDAQGAERMIDELERMASGERSPCMDGTCSKEAVETLHRVKTILSIYQNLAERLGHRVADGIPPRPSPEVSAEDAGAVLAPLANAWRIKVLRVLRSGERSLTDLGRSVSLRTGHLQFHLRALIEAGYVKADRRRHLYSITARGSTALRGAEDLASQLRLSAGVSEPSAGNE
ncbi:MAG: Helix-turn-helix domain protein [Methanomassiliicoccales archaeon PtaU1.Bin030]|nr:MAG: Helix-turn-helix domain protein [Methanomassiliicoccales archaeon PtaU1.Bin030]